MAITFFARLARAERGIINIDIIHPECEYGKRTTRSHAMIAMIRRYFKFEELGTDFKHEMIGGITTFITMAYIIIVNPKILEAAGIPFGPSMITRPSCPRSLAPCSWPCTQSGRSRWRPTWTERVRRLYRKGDGFPRQTALGAIFIRGLLFTALTLLRIRSWLANLIPINLKISLCRGDWAFS